MGNNYGTSWMQITRKINLSILVLLVLGIFFSAKFFIPFKKSNKDCGLRSDEIGKFVTVPAGSFLMGSKPKYLEEMPQRTVFVESFMIQIHEITNDEFARFIAATGYRTTAERKGGSALFIPENVNKDTEQNSWWQFKPMITWWQPEGSGSDIAGKGNHPVVHVSWEDAQAYARWAKARLMTEEEWEYAATLGMTETGNPDSGATGTNCELLANFWQGSFPEQNLATDGFTGLSPAGCFPPSKIGTYDMIGNVWEWTSTEFGKNRYTIKGGSYLCSHDFCHRYRPTARQGIEFDVSTSHIGFRLAKDIDKNQQ
ncbi:MAG: formylglycine-generating enzyme family protein [Leptospiraceae bacterium]|nr:formylglycine-generating enzyme family protein [Leptospiraceae bacterium]